MASHLHTVGTQHIEATGYLSVVGVVILVWDHVLTFPDEVQLIWRARLSIAKVLFLANRYLVPLALLVQSLEISGTSPGLSLPFCKVWYTIAVYVGMLSIASSNFLILLRLWVLWDRRPSLVLGTLTIYVVTQMVALSLAGYVIYDLLPRLYMDPILRVCMPSSKPKFVLLWTPGIAFELMVFLTAVWNALDRPRSNEGMTRVMYRDGSLYFFALFALRLANLILCVAAPASLAFLGVIFLWSVSNITLARLVLNLRRLAPDESDEDVMECAERTELPVVRRECTVTKSAHER